MNYAYKKVNNLPVLFLSTTTAFPISVDISKRINNVFNVSCPLIKYEITKVIINSQIADISTFGNYFALTQNGIFTTFSTAPSSISHSKVYI